MIKTPYGTILVYLGAETVIQATRKGMDVRLLTNWQNNVLPLTTPKEEHHEKLIGVR